MVNTVRPDEKSVMTYVSAYYHAFAGVYKVWILRKQTKLMCWGLWCCMIWNFRFWFSLHDFPFACVILEINKSFKADEKVVMTYVSSYYHAFSTSQKVLINTNDFFQKKSPFFNRRRSIHEFFSNRKETHINKYSFLFELFRLNKRLVEFVKY